jgi:cell division transport system permease protein
MNQYDLPLNKNISAQFVPIMVALMVYLGTLCFVFTLFMVHSSVSWEKQLTTHLSIEIPTLKSDASKPLPPQVLKVLTQTPDVEQATVVPQKDMASLFRSLLGEEVDIDLFSLPVLIDISLKDQEKINLQELEKKLKKISPHIHVTDHRGWQTQVSNLIHTCVFVAFFITLLIILAALATATFATKTSLLIHSEVIEILSLIGATPSYIANQFQTYAFKQALIASILGSSFAFLTFFGLIMLLEKAELPFALQSSFFSQTLLVFGVAPLFMALAMMLSVRIAVMKALRS